MQKIIPVLWFSDKAEEAANFYASIFPNSKINDISRFGEGGLMPKGTVMTATLEILGQRFMTLNGGREPFSQAVSFMVNCETQEEVDRLWNELSEGGVEQPCGWLKDKYGVSWQIIPVALQRLLVHEDPEKAKRVMNAMLAMKKIVIADLERAAE
jgi:predicted 3-demethylubiquinone-9 3-methyltransferase (glyoxalase superfamily)